MAPKVSTQPTSHPSDHAGPPTVFVTYSPEMHVFFVRKTEPPLPSLSMTANHQELNRLRDQGVRVVVV